MSNNPNFVVITPVRDEAQYIEKTIASIRQTILPAQWVIVDDGSTDGTGAILDTLVAQSSWIKVIHRGNRGYRAAGGGVVEAFYAGHSAMFDGKKNLPIIPGNVMRAALRHTAFVAKHVGDARVRAGLLGVPFWTI